MICKMNIFKTNEKYIRRDIWMEKTLFILSINYVNFNCFY